MTLAAITMTAPEAASPVQMYRATYSPDDNKLRLYAVSRLDPETYKKVHDAGFRWAPKQALFVAPAWTPFLWGITANAAPVVMRSVLKTA